MEPKKPKIWLSWIYGLASVGALVVLYMLFSLLPLPIRFYAILALTGVFLAFVVGEVLHIHRTLSYFDKKE